MATNSTLLKSAFENLCRICCKRIEKDKLNYVFEKDDLLEKITRCLPISIHEEDTLPHEVCDSCLTTVESSFDLINTALSSEEFFFNCIKKEGGDDKRADVENSPAKPGDSSQNNKQQLSLDLDGSFHCDICGIQLPEALHLDMHIQEKHGNQSAPPSVEFTVQKICSLCGQLFDCDEMYVLHKCESKHQCPLCNRMVATKCLLNRHIQHACKQLYFCPYCHKTFSMKNAFLTHVQCHSGEDQDNDCLACDKRLYNPEDISEHTCAENTEVDSLDGKKFKCYICGQSYKRQLNLARHCLQHEPKTKWKYKCQKCDEVFEKERKLHSHYEKVHKMPKSWVCRFCGKSLSTKLSVQIHERIHTQVKPYVCEWCGNAFRSKANLIQHHAKHTGIRRHKCPVCGKMFSRTFFLKTHMRVHTGERPYQCDICEQRFTQVGDMRRHRKRHDQISNITQPPPTVIIVRRSSSTANLPVVTFDSLPIETVELKLEQPQQ